MNAVQFTAAFFAAWLHGQLHHDLRKMCLANVHASPQAVQTFEHRNIYASAPGTDRAALAVVAAGPVASTGKDAAALDLVLEKALIFDPDYAQRAGHDAEFLGTTLAMPTVDHAKTAELYLASDYKLNF